MPSAIKSTEKQIIYWHRELPPLDAEPKEEYTLEATSSRVRATLAHRDELWERCYQELMENARERIAQEVLRLGGDFAHVLEEAVDSKRDDVKGEAWLHGQFTYVLYGPKGSGKWEAVRRLL